MKEQIKVTGIILSVFPIGDNDRRLTILTKERGKIQVFAQGCRKPKHKLFAVTQPLILCEFMITESRTAYYLNSAEGKDFFPDIKKDLEDICYSTYFAELAQYFSVEWQDERNILNLLYVTFQAMKKKLISNELIRRIYEFKMLQFYGIGLQSFACIGCGSKENLNWISFEDGGVYCDECKKNHGGRSLDPVVLYTLQYVTAVPLGQLYTFDLEEHIKVEFGWIVNRFFQIHVDYRFKSAGMLDTL